ncbi:TRAP transporter large permease [Mediterraneibacter sp. NSJ-55]|uniref:TRAP transporter large permease n=1 Tax=Mediterraneibacter hominis TaxID=2763054 RepID=A0A923LJS2_9FIRM|nr:TRAP transporter large permease [Mediterraneibacter hominis]MBC5689603.1 TRAP transporter large permease [Mediterraneibacter hominis]
MVIEIGLVLLILFFVMVLMNIPIAVSLGLSTLVTMILYGIPLDMYLDLINSGLAKYSLLAIPFFILAGFVMEKSGISKRIIEFARLLAGPVPGGLGIISIVVAMFWGAISGSGPATVAALGSILIPAMIADGYNKGFAAALLAASSAIAVVIPPSINLVVYGVISGDSIGTLFISGIIPGIIMGICFILYALIYSIRHGYKGERFGTKREIWKGFKESFWGLLSPVIILGGIYGGIFTPTEAAVVAVIYSIIVGLFVYKGFKIKDLWRIFAEAGVSSASIMIIMANAAAMTWLITSQGIATRFGNALLNISDHKIVILLLIDLMLLIAGVFIDGISIAYIFVPLFLPVVQQLGMDPIWFGVVLTVAIAIGFTTPPVAVNLYPACRIANIGLGTISKEVIGFVIAGIIAIILFTVFPELILFVPRAVGML